MSVDDEEKREQRSVVFNQHTFSTGTRDREYWAFKVGKFSLAGSPFARNWDDNREFGFISTGNGRRYLARQPSSGSHIFAYLRLGGYVGYGRLESDLVPAKQLVFADGSRLSDRSLRERRVVTYDDAHDAGVEYAAQVQWFRTFSGSDSQMGTSGGGSAVTYILENQEIVERLLEIFNPIEYSDSELDNQIDWEKLSEEGRRKYRWHLVVERRSSNRRRVLQTMGYACQACGFNSEDVYGQELGRYAEVHHVQPLSLGPQVMSRIEDFAVLCANCHRAIHRLSPAEPLSLTELQSILRTEAAQLLKREASCGKIKAEL